MNTCPHCQFKVQPGEDICENCGAVISTLNIPAVTAPSSSTGTSTTSNPVHVAATSTSAPTAQPRTACPHCKQKVQPNDEICDNCGAVLSGPGAVATGLTTQPALSTSASTIPSIVSGPMACPKCGLPRPPQVKFCNRCGFRFGDVSVVLPDGSVPPSGSQSKLVPGSILHGKYRVTDTIGAGGMGAVYLAEDQVLKRKVVIKTLLNENDAEMAAQSVKEREFLATIKHASIVSIYDFITIGSSGYIVMEYVQGKTLDQLLEEQGKPFEVPTAIRYILGILPAFSYIAKLGLVYCDFKPQNVMVETLRDGSEIVKLIDLGTVIKYEPNPSDVYGTPGFYAREAVKHPSPATDLYSICRTLAYMVTLMDLSNPIFGVPDETEYKAFRDYPALYRLLRKGTQQDAKRRFQSAEELSEQLQGVLRQAEGGKPGVHISSNQFISSMLTTSGKLGLRGHAALDEQDKAIDTLRHGDLALRAGSLSNAIDIYRQAQVANKRSLDSYLRLAEAYIDDGKYTLARAEIAEAKQFAPDHWKILWYQGRLFEAQGKYNEAATQYEELMRHLPGELPPQQALARVYVRQGKIHEAINLYNAILKADPGNTEACLELADAQIKIQRWHEAGKALESVNETAAKYVDAQLSLCDLYLNKIQPLQPQNIQKALSALDALAQRTEDARFFLMRAEAYYTAWQWKRTPQGTGQQLPGNLPPARKLGELAVQNYEQYLRRSNQSTDRENIIRRKIAVTPWRLW